jgi:hypothetical protein
MVGHLLFAQENKHVLYGYVPKNWKLWGRGHIIFGKIQYSQQWTCSETLKQDMRNNCITATYRKGHDWQYMASRQIHIPAQQSVGLKCYTKDVPEQKALHTKCILSLEQTFWVLNPLLPPSVNRSNLQFLTCCQPRYIECIYGCYTFKTPPPWAAVKTLNPRQQWRTTSIQRTTDIFVQGISFLWHLLEFKAKNFRN